MNAYIILLIEKKHRIFLVKYFLNFCLWSTPFLTSLLPSNTNSHVRDGISIPEEAR